MMIIQGIIELGYNIHSAWFLDIRISTCLKCMAHVCEISYIAASPVPAAKSKHIWGKP